MVAAQIQQSERKGTIEQYTVCVPRLPIFRASFLRQLESEGRLWLKGIILKAFLTSHLQKLMHTARLGPLNIIDINFGLQNTNGWQELAEFLEFSDSADSLQSERLTKLLRALAIDPKECFPRKQEQARSQYDNISRTLNQKI